MSGRNARRSRRAGPTDPRRPGGDISGPGGPYDRDAVVVETTDAVILDHTTVATVEFHRAGEPAEIGFTMLLEGRINKSTERTRILYVMNADGLAGVVTELLGVASRSGRSDLVDEVLATLEQRWREMPK